MYKKILVPLDGSKRAEAILPHVEGLIEDNGGEVMLLQVIEPHALIVTPVGGYPLIEQEWLKRETQNAEKYLIALQNKLRLKGISSRKHIAQGPIVEEIINAAEREDADLIAMASHGRTGLSRAFYGSVAAGVLHRIDRPLLIVRSLDHN